MVIEVDEEQAENANGYEQSQQPEINKNYNKPNSNMAIPMPM